MTTLITGAGLVGTETARLLSARGETCVLVDIRPPVPEILALPGVCFEAGDVTDMARLQDLIGRHGITRIAHTAAVLSNGMRANPMLGLQVNLMGTAGVLTLARDHGIRRVVTVSSTTVLYSGFGVLGPDPIPEDAALPLVSARPRSLYAMTKLAGENLGFLYRDLYGVDHVALRFAAVVGGDTSAPTSVPGQLFGRLVAAAQSGTDLVLDSPLHCWAGTEEFVDLRDCARALVHALDAPSAPLGVYNIAHPRQWRFSDVVETVARLHGPFRVTLAHTPTTGFAGFPHVRPAPSSTEAARTELGFTCSHDLADSLSRWW